MAFTPPRLNNTNPWKNLNIGLFGGTFNPPHEGHIHICKTALRQHKFDFIWWMVTPQNPLKIDDKIPKFEDRYTWSENMIHEPRVIVTDIEKQLGTYKSIDTIRVLKRRFPKTHFTFIAGMDNALNLHHWEDWQKLISEIPFLFVARPPALNLVRNIPAKMIKKSNIEWLYRTKMIDQSSTQLRQNALFVEK